MHVVTYQVETLFRALADPVRVRVVRLLAVTGEEACTCEFVDSLLEPEEQLSQHIEVLHHAGVLNSAREGRWIYYRLVKDVPYLEHLYAMVRELPNENQVFSGDLMRFQARLYLRECGRCRTGVQIQWLRAEER